MGLSQHSQSIRILTAQDQSLLANIFDNYSVLQSLEQLNQYLTADPQRQLIGFFADGELQAFCGLYFFEKLPWGSIPFLQVNRQMSTAQRLQALIQIVDEAFLIFEARGIVRIFMANEMKKREGHLNAKLHPLAKKIPRLQKYVFISEGFVKAGEKPYFSYQWQLLGQQPALVDVGFASATRKNIISTPQTTEENISTGVVASLTESENISLDSTSWNDFPYVTAAVKFKKQSEVFSASDLLLIENCFQRALHQKRFRMFLFLPVLSPADLAVLVAQLIRRPFFSEFCDLFQETFLPEGAWLYPGLAAGQPGESGYLLSISLNRKAQAGLLGLIDESDS